MVSLARSGDSPESVGALSLLLETEPDLRHLVLTCNKNGRLAATYRDDPRVMVITLDDRTNDRSLVMTSSFTNMVLAARFLGFLDRGNDYQMLCEQLSLIAQNLIQQHFMTFADIGELDFQRALFLGDGARSGAVREAALKMLEMTAGRVSSMCETYLGIRHGPMTYVNPKTLIVCFLSSSKIQRAYEMDLIEELNRKRLGFVKVILGEDIPKSLAREEDVLVECAGLRKAGDENVPVIDVIAGQLLAFFRCRKEGLRPDCPSEGGIINRVVQSFQLHHHPLPQRLG
jgi:tagatose-6-phosphate ketose/aldose isomerase